MRNVIADVTPNTPRRKGGRFANPWPDVENHGFGDVVKWAFARRGKTGVSKAELEYLGRAKAAYPIPRAPSGILTATWVGHTTALLQLGGLNILTDPVWSDRASPVSFTGPKRFSAPGISLDDLPPIDLILISHDHYDHLDAGSVSELVSRFPTASWRAPLGVGEFLRRRGAADVKELTWHDSSEVNGLHLTCVPAQHFSGRGLFSRNSTLWCGWVLSADTRSVYFAGDTALNPSFADIGARYGPFDIALMPIGAYDPRWFMRSVHMDPEECVAAVQMLAPKSEPPLLLATHWGAFKLTDEPLDEPPKRMLAAWAAAGLPPDKLWIASLGETRTI